MKIEDIKFSGQSLKEKLTNPYVPITTVQDIEFPPKEARKYTNYLVAVIDRKDKSCHEYNFVMKDGTKSQIISAAEMEEVRL